MPLLRHRKIQRLNKNVSWITLPPENFPYVTLRFTVNAKMLKNTSTHFIAMETVKLYIYSYFFAPSYGCKILHLKLNITKTILTTLSSNHV